MEERLPKEVLGLVLSYFELDSDVLALAATSRGMMAAVLDYGRFDLFSSNNPSIFKYLETRGRNASKRFDVVSRQESKIFTAEDLSAKEWKRVKPMQLRGLGICSVTARFDAIKNVLTKCNRSKLEVLHLARLGPNAVLGDFQTQILTLNNLHSLYVSMKNVSSEQLSAVLPQQHALRTLVIVDYKGVTAFPPNLVKLRVEAGLSSFINMAGLLPSTDSCLQVLELICNRYLITNLHLPPSLKRLQVWDAMQPLNFSALTHLREVELKTSVLSWQTLPAHCEHLLTCKIVLGKASKQEFIAFIQGAPQLVNLVVFDELESWDDSLLCLRVLLEKPCALQSLRYSTRKCLIPHAIDFLSGFPPSMSLFLSVDMTTRVLPSFLTALSNLPLVECNLGFPREAGEEEVGAFKQQDDLVLDFTQAGKLKHLYLTHCTGKDMRIVLPRSTQTLHLVTSRLRLSASELATICERIAQDNAMLDCLEIDFAFMAQKEQFCERMLSAGFAVNRITSNTCLLLRNNPPLRPLTRRLPPSKSWW